MDKYLELCHKFYDSVFGKTIDERNDKAVELVIHDLNSMLLFANDELMLRSRVDSSGSDTMLEVRFKEIRKTMQESLMTIGTNMFKGDGLGLGTAPDGHAAHDTHFCIMASECRPYRPSCHRRTRADRHAHPPRHAVPGLHPPGHATLWRHPSARHAARCPRHGRRMPRLRADKLVLCDNGPFLDIAQGHADD